MFKYFLLDCEKNSKNIYTIIYITNFMEKITIVI